MELKKIMANANLSKAKNAKNDEFYTQYPNIEKEMNAYIEYNPNVFKNKIILCPCDDPEWSNFTKYFAQNFEKLKLKKLISTSFAVESKEYKGGYKVTTFESKSQKFDKNKTRIKGKNFTLAKDKTGDSRIDINDLDYKYLEGDGDFRSDEVTKLRNEADIIITNPPFSLFREFLGWIIEANKKFVIIGNINAITYRELFPFIKENKIWLGATNFNTGMYFKVSTDFVYSDSYKFEREINGEKVSRVPGVCWFTNVEHGRRHQPLPLMTMKDNLKYNKNMKDKKSYDKYDNYDAIDVSFTNAIPSDYKGIMGVPITFLDKYSPEQFEIIWQSSGNTRASAPKEILKRLNYRKHSEDRGGCSIVHGKRTYGRVLIKHKEIKGKK